MNIKFSPNNAIIKLCMSGRNLEDSGKMEDAITIFDKAWFEAKNDYERLIAAYYVVRDQKEIADKLKWMEASLKYALKM